ncbi:MAG: glycosyltransferase family 4 protein [Thermoanaerobaculia bacterium]|nr:glycosyltransferase family 4 protein [Thermoanaerobaculia bacterium]
MIVGVVAQEMEGEPTGVGRYLENLLCGLQSADSFVEEWVLFFRGSPFAHPLWSDRATGTSTVIRPQFDCRDHSHPVLWEQMRLPRLVAKAKLDAIFSPAYSLPGRPRIPSLVTLHDLSFIHRGHELGWKERIRRRWLARRAVRLASRILTDTETIREEVSETYGIASDRIGVVPIAVDGRFTPRAEPSDPEDLAALGLRSGDLLFLGSILPRRHLDRVLQVFGRLVQNQDVPPTTRLILVGANRLPDPSTLGRWIREADLEGQVVPLGYVSDAQLPAIYRSARLTFYPSEYEGYGLPPLESLASGTPCIVTPGLALDDLWPQYPYRAADSSVDTLYSAARRALDEGADAASITKEGVARVRSVTTESCARRFLEELRLAVDPGTGNPQVET